MINRSLMSYTIVWSSKDLILAKFTTYSDCISVYLVDSDSPSGFLGTKCFASPKFYNSAFVAFAWWMLRSLEPLGTRLFLTHTTRRCTISYFVWLVVLPQYDKEDDKTMELSALLASQLSVPSPSPTQIWRMGITSVETIPDVTPVESTPVDSPPLPDVEIWFIFKDYKISIISTNSPSTQTREVWGAGNRMFSNSLATDESLLENVDLSDKWGIKRVRPHFPLLIVFVKDKITREMNDNKSTTDNPSLRWVNLPYVC